MSKVAALRAMREAKHERAKTESLAAPEGPRRGKEISQGLETGKRVASALLAPKSKVNNVINERQSKWREAHPDTNRQRAKEGMRKLRAKRLG
jgi:hypothetical protein